MALTLKNNWQAPRTIKGYRDSIEIGADNDEKTVAWALDPKLHNSFHVQKAGESAKVYLTNTVVDKTGALITDLNHADIIWRQRSSGTTEFFVGSENGLSGIKVEADAAGATMAIIDISIAQFPV